MAFITLRRSRNTRSFYLVESYRDDQGRARKRTFCYLGREQDGTDTLAKALTHWETVQSQTERQLIKAEGEWCSAVALTPSRRGSPSCGFTSSAQQ